jgi:hypothetical protein
VAATAVSRTFVVRSPHMTGEDVRELQVLLNARRDATVQVCIGLGIATDAMTDGLEPELRIKTHQDPNHPQLVWGGPVIGDRVHFSATGR